MKVKKYLMTGLLPLALGCTALSAQSISINQLNINNVKATVAADGLLFKDGYSQNAGYEVPKNSQKQALYSGALWIGGMDAGGQLHVAAMTYRQAGSDFFPGPLDTVNITASCPMDTNFNYVWEINKPELDTFLNGSLMSGDISTWPGNGDISQNQGKFLAPFNDVDADGMYNPAAGDHPLIKGDQMAFAIMNDACLHTETGSQPLGVEVHLSAYEYACDSLPDSLQVLNNTSFYHYKVINRNSYAYTNVYFSFWLDVELGNGSDDLVGCHVNEGTGFVFNSAGNDSIYGHKNILLSVTQLKGPLADAGDMVNNDRDSVYAGGVSLGPDIDEAGEQCIFNKFMYYGTGVPVSSGNTAPATVSEYYNYMKGLWNDGSPLTYGGSGYNSGGMPCNYAFPGSSDPNGYGTSFNPQAPWYAYDFSSGSAIDLPADKKILVTAGPFTMQPGEVNETEYAIVFTMDTSAGANYSTLMGKTSDGIKKIKSWYAAGNFPSCSGIAMGISQVEKAAGCTIYPNPAENFITVQLNGNKESAKVELYDATGRYMTGKQITVTEKFDISSFAKGIYFIKVYGKRDAYSAKFIKQ